MSTTRRITQALLGVTLAAFGAAGLTTTWGPAPAQAQSGEPGSHDTMHEMMEQCAGMMDAMGGMSEMMDGRGMSGMMGGQGSSDTMRGRMGR